MEELILLADVIARVRLLEIGDRIVAHQPADIKLYQAELWYEFEVLEYLKGSGGAAIWGVTRGPSPRTEEEAIAAIMHLRNKRDDRWDDREAIVFLYEENTITPSIDHSDGYWLGMFLTFGLPLRNFQSIRESHSLELAGGWFPMATDAGAPGARYARRFMLTDPDLPADDFITEDAKRARNAWRKSWPSGSPDMTTMGVLALKWLIANEPELLRQEQEREIAFMQDITAPEYLTATQADDGSVTLRWASRGRHHITNYRVLRRASGASEFTRISDVAPTQWDMIYKDTTAIEPGVAYTYKVIALLKDDVHSIFDTSYGEFGGEAEVSITISAAPLTTTPTPTPKLPPPDGASGA